MAGMSYALYRACSLIMLSLTAVVYGDPAICTLLKTLVVKSVKRKMTAIIVFLLFPCDQKLAESQFISTHA